MQQPVLTSLALMDLLPGDLQDTLVGAGTSVKYHDGQFLHGRGDEKPGLSVVLGGAISVGSQTKDGMPIPTTLLTAGHCFGEITCFGKLPRSHDAIAVGPTTVLQVPQARVLSLFAGDPRFSLAFVEMMTSRLYRALDALEDFRRYPPIIRLAKLILERAVDCDGQGRIRVQQADLAYTIGVSRVTVSGLLAKLESSDLLRRGYGYLKVDIPELKKWLRKEIHDELG